MPQDTWQHQSPPAPKGGSGTVGHVATPKPSLARRRARCHGTHGDAGALLCRVWGLESWDLTYVLCVGVPGPQGTDSLNA
jgi:hypothetical protein